MLLIYRSILKEMTLAFFVSLVFLNSTLMMEKMLRLNKLFTTVGATLTDIITIMLFIQPQILVMSLPMSLLISTLVVYGRMNADNELTILKGAGVSFFKISRPVWYFGMVCLALSLLMSFYLGPLGAVSARKKVTEIITTRAPLTIEEGLFNTAFKDIVILVREKPDTVTMGGIFIVDDRKKDEQKILTAKKGRIVPMGETLGFKLNDGKIYLFRRDSYTEISFASYSFKLKTHTEVQQKSINELTLGQLLQEAEANPEQRVRYILEYHRRFSMPALCIIMVILGPALALRAGKTGRLGGLTIGLAVFGSYYIMLIYGESLAYSQRIPPFVGAWGAFFIIASFSLFVSMVVNRR